jgi:hypothetical protein
MGSVVPSAPKAKALNPVTLSTPVPRATTSRRPVLVDDVTGDALWGPEPWPADCCCGCLACLAAHPEQ